MGSLTGVARATLYAGAIALVIASGLVGSKDHVLAQATGKDVPASGTAQVIPVPAKHATARKQSPAAPANQPLRTLDPVKLQKAKTAANDRAAAAQLGLSPVASPAGQPYGVYSGVNRPGLSASGCCSPSDSTGAVGPTNYVQMVNSAIEQLPVHVLAGNASALDLGTFGAFNATDCTYDPQIAWDEQGGRWLYSFLDQVSSTGSGCASISSNYLAFGWSKTSDASDLVNGWCGFLLITGSDLFDYPKLGHDNNFISVGANVYANSGGGAFTTSVIVAIPKPARADTSCTVPPPPTYFGSPATPLRNADNTVAFTPVPADTADSSPLGYVVASHFPGTGTATRLMVWHLSSNAGTPVLTADGDVTVAGYAVPPAIPQPATGTTSCSTAGNCLDSNDGRLTQAVAHFDPDAGKETIWTQHAIADAAVGTLSVERWYELIPGQNTLRQSGNVSDTTLHIFNGAISPSSAGNEAVMYYNAGNGSAGGFASFRAKSRNSSTPLGTVTNETILASDAINDNDLSCGVNRRPVDLTLPCRWGDYAAARPDPLDANAVWGTSMLTGTGGTSTTAGWRTAIAAYTNGCPWTVLSPHSSSAITGSTNQFTATSMGCSNPEYEFFVGPSTGNGPWTLKQAFSASNTWTWDTSGYSAGDYDVQVWANQTGDSTANWEAMNIANITLTQSPPCTAVTASATPASPSLPGTAVTVTASASGCPNPRYQFWILAPGSSTWTIAQAYSASATFNWNTTAQAAGTYQFSVWARDAGSAAAYDTYVPGFPYTLRSAACTSVTASAAPASPQLPGTAVTITASASGCPNARYQFWILAPGSSTWTIAQAYSASATFNWTTTGLAAGTYSYSVWVRDASSAASYDAFLPGTAYKLTSTACTSVTASAAPASPQAVGTAVTISASASGCPNARYQFWILAPGGSWKIAQAYSSSATFNWTTTGLAAGTYTYSVWVRDASSAAAYDAFSPGTAYTLTTTPCASLTASAAPASPQVRGTSVTITASVSGCPNPQYEFWILAPGSSTWTMVQGYSSNGTFIWNTTGLAAGTYKFSVWVRDASSGAGYDAYFPGATYTLT